jgi:hypothetical protein
MRLMLWAILLMLSAAIVPLDLPWQSLKVWVFIIGYFAGMALFITGFGRSMSLPGFKQWNEPKKKRPSPKPWFISLI